MTTVTTQTCTDRDLLALEPVIFLGSGLGTQQIVAGSGGQTAGTTFTAAGVDFVAAGVQAGMVLTTYNPANGAAEGNAFEIVGVLSQTQLSVSVLRPTLSSPAVAPLPGGASFLVRTYQPQIQGVYDTLMERMRQLGELVGVDASAFADSPQLRLTLACGALSSIYVTRAQSSPLASDPNWVKAEHYKTEFARLCKALRLTGADADGAVTMTRSLGNVMLRRA